MRGKGCGQLFNAHANQLSFGVDYNTPHDHAVPLYNLAAAAAD